MYRRILLSLAVMALLVSVAHASPWQYPDEVSVAEVYNTLYGTSYDTTDSAGLAALMADYGAPMQSVWNTNLFSTIQIPIYDSGSTAAVGVRYGAGFSNYAQIFDPGVWTSPSRGYLPNGGAVIDLASLIGANTDFQWVVGNTVLDASNAIALYGVDNLLFIGYNEGGFTGDQDFNEPLIRSVSSTPIPASLLLLGSGVAGLLGYRRLRGAAA